MTSSSTTTSIKIVLDTNLFLSAFIYQGISKIIFDLIRNDILELYISPDLKIEVRKKIKEYYGTEEAPAEFDFFLDLKGIFISPSIKITACRDPEDNFLLELSEESKADYLVTRDKDLLELPAKHWKETKIIKPEDFLPILREIHLV